MRAVDDKFKIFSGTANAPLADEVCQFLGMPRGQAQVTRFADGECYVQIQENVRGCDVFVMQPTCRPVDMHLMELLLMIDALKRASARRITAVIPYFGYARQDRKDKPRSPISSKLVADLLTTAGAHRALIVDLHTPQLQGFFNIPVDHLFASPVLVDHFKKLSLPNLTVVSPDAGGVERARFFAKKVDAALAIVDKRRVEMNVAEIMHVIGDVHGRTCLIIDDLIDTAGTLVKTAAALMENGATTVYACASHRGVIGTGGGEYCEVGDPGSGGDEHDSAECRSGAARKGKGGKITRAFDRRPDWAGDPGKSRRDFSQQTIYLI